MVAALQNIFQLGFFTSENDMEVCARQSGLFFVTQQFYRESLGLKEFVVDFILSKNSDVSEIRNLNIFVVQCSDVNICHVSFPAWLALVI